MMFFYQCCYSLPHGPIHFLSILTALTLYLLVKCQSTHHHHRYTLRTVKIFSPITYTLWGSPHYPRSSDFEISLVKYSLLKSVVIMFSLSLSFETLPFVFSSFGTAEWPCLPCTAQSWKVCTLSPEYTTANSLCYMCILSFSLHLMNSARGLYFFFSCELFTAQTLRKSFLC